MRSRNGNYSFTLAIFSLIFFHSLVLNAASEYLISYKYTVKNAILYNEDLEISRSMKRCSGTAYDTIIFKSDTSKNLNKIITQNHDKFITFLNKLGVNIEHTQKISNNQSKSTTVITLRTTCFKVDFNDNFVKISSLK
jgi:hypothetical protein